MTRTFRRPRASDGVIVWNQALPDEFASMLRFLHRTDADVLDATLLKAIEAGWTATVMADAVGLTRERILQRAHSAPAGVDSVEIPPPPRRPEPAPCSR